MMMLWRFLKPVMHYDGPRIDSPPSVPTPPVGPASGPPPTPPPVAPAAPPAVPQPPRTQDTVTVNSPGGPQTPERLAEEGRQLVDEHQQVRQEMQTTPAAPVNRMAELRARETAAFRGRVDQFLAGSNLDEATKTKVRDYLTNLPSFRNQALSALQALDARHQLTSQVVDQLQLLMDPRTPMAEGVNRDMLFLHTLADLEAPTAIRQGGKNTCAATAVQMALMMRDPARYVQTLRLLASPSGDASAVTPGLTRLPGEIPSDDRTMTVRLMTPALMNLGSGGYYNAATDRQDYPAYRVDLPNDHIGLQPQQTQRLLQDVLGLQVDRHTCQFWGNADVWNKIDTANQQGHVVPVSVNWNGVGHFVHFMGTATGDDGQQYALLLNPMGERTRMPLADFQKNLQAAYIPKEGQTPIPRPDNWNAISSYALPERNRD